MQDGRNIIFFDGVCNLCNGFVDFVIHRNKKQDLHYASLQSDAAKQFLGKLRCDVSGLSTIYFYSAGILYSKSTAVLQICKNLSGFYPAFASALLLVNRRFRDFIYEQIAANRYKMWGKKDTCRLPTQQEQELFLS
jgi:predicted DCC family thiol-disulfide oxidoreductase YuxK